MRTISLRQFSARSLFKIGLLANVGIWIPFGLLMGLGALAGLNWVRLNGVQAYGLKGLLGGILIGALFTLAGSLIFVIGAKLAGLAGERLPEVAMRDDEDGTIG